MYLAVADIGIGPEGRTPRAPPGCMSAPIRKKSWIRHWYLEPESSECYIYIYIKHSDRKYMPHHRDVEA